MSESFERFSIEEKGDGFEIFFNANRKPILIFLATLLGLVGITLFFLGSADLFGASILLVIAVFVFLFGNKRSEKFLICDFVNNKFSFSEEFFSVENKNDLIVPANVIRDIRIEVRQEKTLNVWMIAAFQYRVVFDCMDPLDVSRSRTFHTGFDFSFKKNANAFVEKLKKLISFSEIEKQQSSEVSLEDLAAVDFVIRSVDYAPAGLEEQTPIVFRIIKKIPGDDRPDYWLCESKKPIIWNDNNVYREITHLIVAARWVGTQIRPGIRQLPVGIAFVVEESLLNDSKLDFDKCVYVAIGTLSDSSQKEEDDSGNIQAGTIGPSFGAGKEE